MLPLARFWTWIGTAYIPAAASGIFYINNGPHRGVLISAGYLGLCASLAVGTILAGTLALYVMKARKSRIRFLLLRTPYSKTRGIEIG